MLILAGAGLELVTAWGKRVLAVQAEQDKLRRKEQRRVRGTVCRLLLVHQMVSAGLLDAAEGAKVIAHKGGRVKRKENK